MTVNITLIFRYRIQCYHTIKSLKLHTFNDVTADLLRGQTEYAK